MSQCRLVLPGTQVPDLRAEFERSDDSLLVVLRTVWYVDDANTVERGQVSVFVGDRTAVTVWNGARDQRRMP